MQHQIYQKYDPKYELFDNVNMLHYHLTMIPKLGEDTWYYNTE